MQSLLTLPQSLLALLTLLLPSAAENQAWTLDGIDQPNISPRDIELYHKLQTQTPMFVRKMSSHDPGQMFHISDWRFDDPDDNTSHTNSSLTSHLDLPLLLHGSDSEHPQLLRPLSSRFLHRRAASDFACPANTNSCASIGADYGCCPQGTTCQLDSKGSLGCCPGSTGTCTGNTPTNCEQGYTSCPLFRGGGGCCAQGFQCQSQGCVGVSTTVVVVYPTVTATRSNPSTTAAVTTTTTTPTPTPTPSASTSTPSSTTAEETTPLVPILPTSLTTSTSTTSSAATFFLGPCPTGYYACSAVFNAGSCCQIGRDCGRISCPPLITSTALISNGVTIAGVSASGLCATGWTTCVAGVGGGCCPGGYACGTQLCSATASAQASLGGTVAKEASGNAAARRDVGGYMAVWGMVLVLVVGF